ncbi:MAG: energy transducer TonB [Elstera sp.]
MFGGRAESKAGGAFLASLLVHGALIAGIASIPALRPGLPKPDPMPITLMLLPAPVADAAPPVQNAPPPAPEPIAVPPPPIETPAPPPPEPVRVAAAPLPPSLPEALTVSEPSPVAAPPPKQKAVSEKTIPRKPPPKAAVLAAASAGPASDVSTSISNTPTPAPITPPSPAPSAPEVAAVPLITEPRFREPPVKPAYPPRAAALDQQGEALVRVRVGPEGDQEEVLLWRSSGFELLDRAALATVRRWQFEPYRRDGIAFAAWVQVPIRFTLN